LSLGGLAFLVVAFLAALEVFVIFFLDIVRSLRYVKPAGVATSASLRQVTVITSVPARHPALFGSIPADSFRRIALTEQPVQHKRTELFSRPSSHNSMPEAFRLFRNAAPRSESLCRAGHCIFTVVRRECFSMRGRL